MSKNRELDRMVFHEDSDIHRALEYLLNPKEPSDG